MLTACQRIFALTGMNIIRIFLRALRALRPPRMMYRRYAEEQKNSANPAKKCHVHISPCGVIGPNHCDRRGRIHPNVAIRMPVSRLTTNAMAVVQCSTIVPTSLRGGRSVRAPVRGSVFIELIGRAVGAPGSPSRTAISAIYTPPFAGGGIPNGFSAVRDDERNS